MRRIWMITLLFSLVGTLRAQPEITVDEYIDRYKDIAMDQMQKTGIPSSIILAQGILESRYGNSTLARASNNHFGIKCHTGWEGKRYYHDDDHKNECFRVYRNPEESFRDHSEFLTGRSRYAFLFDYGPTDYKNWAHGLKQAGYATNPKYGHILIDLIERHQLYLYDRPGADLIARGKHQDRNDQQGVSGERDFRMTDNPAEKEQAVTSASASTEISYNRIRAVIVSKYDNIYMIANTHQVPAHRILKYNDLAPGQEIVEGQVLYLQPKRGKTRHRAHIVQRDETMWSISQMYGVKLDKLYQRNMLNVGEEPAAGAVLELNHKTDKKPPVRLFEPVPEPAPAVAKPSPEKQETMKPDQTPATSKEPVSITDVEPVAVPVEKQEESVASEKDKAVEEAAKAAVEAMERIAEETKPQPASTDQKPEGKDAAQWKKVHAVEKGQTLYSISRMYSVTVDNLRTWNNLSDNLISIGQKLIVSP